MKEMKMKQVIYPVIIGVLAIALIILGVNCYNLSKENNQLETKNNKQEIQIAKQAYVISDYKTYFRENYVDTVKYRSQFTDKQILNVYREALRDGKISDEGGN